MKKNIIIFLIVFGIFVFLPSNVLGKEFKQINQISKEQNYYWENYRDTYKLSNGDYIVASGEYLARISSNGSIVWINDAYTYDYEILVLDDYVYVSYEESLDKINISDGSVNKHRSIPYAYRLVNLGEYIYALDDDGNVVKLDKDLNAIEVFDTNDGLSSNQYSYNANMYADNTYIYVLNIVGTEISSNNEEYETQILKFDSNLNKVGTLSVSEKQLDSFYEPGQFFTDKNGNMYLISGLIAKIDKNGSMKMIYDYPFYLNGRSSHPTKFKYYSSGVIVDNYIVAGGLDVELNPNYPIIKPLVHIYDLNGKYIEEYELKSNNIDHNNFEIFNVSTTSTNGFIVKWVSGVFIEQETQSGSFLGPNSNDNPLLNVTEFARINPVKINVKGMGNVKIKNSDCACGEMAELDITPKAGYYLKSLVVRNSAGQKIEVKDNKFVMPCDGDVIIDAQFREITNPKTNSIIIISVIVLISAIVSTIVVRKRVKG